MGENDFDLRFGADGLLHPAVPQNAPRPNGRRDLFNEDTYNDAYVCLTCTEEVCEGERDCFVRRKKALETKKTKEKDYG